MKLRGVVVNDLADRNARETARMLTLLKDAALREGFHSSINLAQESGFSRADIARILVGNFVRAQGERISGRSGYVLADADPRYVKLFEILRIPASELASIRALQNYNKGKLSTRCTDAGIDDIDEDDSTLRESMENVKIAVLQVIAPDILDTNATGSPDTLLEGIEELLKLARPVSLSNAILWGRRMNAQVTLVNLRTLQAILKIVNDI